MEKMNDLFYLLKTESGGKDWYMLRVRKTHFCVSCGSDKDKVLSALTKGIIKHRNTSKMVRHLEKLSRLEKMGRKTFDYYEELYWSSTDLYEDEIEAVIDSALLIVQKSSKENNMVLKNKKKIGKVKTLEVAEEEIIEDIKEDTPKESKSVLIKPKLLKRK